MKIAKVIEEEWRAKGLSEIIIDQDSTPCFDYRSLPDILSGNSGPHGCTFSL